MADVLKTESRQFFERTKAKLAISIVVGASSLMLLGFGAYAAGQAASYNTMVSARGPSPLLGCLAQHWTITNLYSFPLIPPPYPIQYYKYEKTQTDDYLKEAANNQLSGYGFASFCYILATLLLIAAAVYVSPVMCGSVNEQKMIKAPQEIEEGYANFDGDGDDKEE